MSGAPPQVKHPLIYIYINNKLLYTITNKHISIHVNKYTCKHISLFIQYEIREYDLLLN